MFEVAPNQSLLCKKRIGCFHFWTVFIFGVSCLHFWRCLYFWAGLHFGVILILKVILIFGIVFIFKFSSSSLSSSFFGLTLFLGCLHFEGVFIFGVVFIFEIVFIFWFIHFLRSSHKIVSFVMQRATSPKKNGVKFGQKFIIAIICNLTTLYNCFRLYWLQLTGQIHINMHTQISWL